MTASTGTEHKYNGLHIVTIDIIAWDQSWNYASSLARLSCTTKMATITTMTLGAQRTILRRLINVAALWTVWYDLWSTGQIRQFTTLPAMVSYCYRYSDTGHTTSRHRTTAYYACTEMRERYLTHTASTQWTYDMHHWNYYYTIPLNTGQYRMLGYNDEIYTRHMIGIWMDMRTIQIK